MMRIPFSRPDITEEEISEVARVMRSGWVTSGPEMKLFEAEFAQQYPGTQAVAVNSATAGLHLALEALGVKEGDHVLVPALTFTATAEVVRYFGAVPVFCDVDPVTGNMTVATMAKAATERTVGVVPVHYAGLPVDVVGITQYAHRRGWFVLEDAAHAYGSVAGEVPVGASDSDATVFSFYANKCMTTGEGGMIVSRNPKVVSRCRVMRLHGIDRDAFDRYRTTSKSAWAYDVIAPGYKYNMTDIAAAIGRVQLRRHPEMLRRRDAIAHRYHAELSPEFKVAPIQSSVVHSWHLFPVGVPDAEGFIAHLTEHGVGSSVHFIPLYRLEYWSPGYDPAQFPGVEARWGKTVSIPLFSAMSDVEVDRVIEVCNRYWK